MSWATRCTLVLLCPLPVGVMRFCPSRPVHAVGHVHPDGPRRRRHRAHQGGGREGARGGLQWGPAAGQNIANPPPRHHGAAGRWCQVSYGVYVLSPSCHHHRHACLTPRRARSRQLDEIGQAQQMYTVYLPFWGVRESLTWRNNIHCFIGFTSPPPHTHAFCVASPPLCRCAPAAPAWAPRGTWSVWTSCPVPPATAMPSPSAAGSTPRTASSTSSTGGHAAGTRGYELVGVWAALRGWRGVV